MLVFSVANPALAQSNDDASKRLAEIDARMGQLAKESAALREERLKLVPKNADTRHRNSHVDVDQLQGLAMRQSTNVAPKPASSSSLRNWSGFYVGANAGDTWGRDSVTGTEVAPIPPFSALDVAAVNSAASPTLRFNGFTGGAQVGYNYQVGHAVLGVENDFGAFRLRGSTTGTFPFVVQTPGAISPTTSLSTDWLYTARARIGWATYNWLAYVTGGLALTRENFSQSIAVVPPFVFNSPITATQAGWIVGGGVEYALNDRWSMKAEYFYADFGSVSGVGVLTPGFAGFFYTNSSRLTASLARFGVNYRIGGP